MRSKIIILAIFVFLVSLLITLNVIFHESLRDELVAQYNKQQVFVAKGISGSIKTSIDKEAGKLRLLARLFSQHPNSDKEALRKIAEDTFAFDNEMKVHTTVYNETGDVMFSTLYPETEPTENTGYFYRAKALPEGDIGIFHDMKRVVILSPLYREKKFSGGILLEMSLEDLSTRFLTPFKSMEKGYAWLMDGDGNLLYHPTQHAMIGRNLYSAREECFRCHRTFELEKRVLQEPDVEFGRYISPNKEDKVLAFSKVAIGDSSWIISVSSPYTEVISITERSMKLYSWLVVAIFATVFLGASVVILINRRHMKTEKDAKESVLLEKQKLDTIVSAIGSGLMLLDRDHKILWINKTLRDWAGNVEGNDCGVVFPPKTMHEDMRGDIFHDTYTDLFGERGRTFDVTSAPVKDKDGNLIGMLKLIQDVTEVKKLEAGIMHSEKLAALGRLAAGVAHEIGNPLTSISSFAQILKSKANDDFTKESLDTIYHHIMRISGIVSQMSRLSKLPEMDLRQCNINNLIESTLDIVKYDNKLKDITIIKELSAGIPSVYVDENYLVQVFINLMLNAADAIPDGKGTITIKSMKDNNSVIVQYIDSGIGIPAESLNKIFDPFFTTKEKGTGLGLSISYEIIKRFGGELKAESREGNGSVFSVNLPVGDIEDE